MIFHTAVFYSYGYFCTPRNHYKAAPSGTGCRMQTAWLLLAALLAFGAAAQTSREIPEVRVEGHYDNSVGTSNAASEGIVTQRRLENRPLLRPGEVLEFVPGMIVTQHSGDGKANQYFLRGFNLDHGTDFATLVDGMPVNMRSHAHGQGYSDLNFLLPELVDHIHYRKGPYYAEDGDFASAGSARLQLKDRMPQGLALLTAGAYGYQRLIVANSLDLAGRSMLFGFEAAGANGPWENPERLRKISGVLRLSEGSAQNGHSLTAMGYSAKWNSTDQIPLRAVGAGTLNRFGSLDTSDGGETQRYSLSYSMRRQTEGRQLQVSAYLIRSRLDLYSNFTFALDDPVNGDQFRQSERRKVAGFDVSHAWQGLLGGKGSEFRAGLQGRFDRLAPIGLYATVARRTVTTIREDRVGEDSLAVFAEHTLHWSNDLRSIVGLRHDQFRFDVASDRAINSGKVRAGLTSPKISMIYRLGEKIELFGNAGKGFHSNDARGTTQTFAPKTALAVNPVTPLVRTRGAELGLRLEPVAGLQSSMALWRLDLESELVFVGDAGETQPSRASTRRGIEWNNHYALNRWLLLDFDVALSRAHFTQSDPAGDRVPGAIERAVSFGATLADRGPWFGSFQMRYLGSRPLNADNRERSGPTILANARAGYKLTQRVRLTADVFNLFNRKANDIDYFYASRLPGEPAAGVSDRHFHPVEPRSLRLSVQITL